MIALPGAALAGLVAVLGTDPVQRFFSIVVVLVLLALAVADLVFRPRLVVDADGLRVFGPFDRVALPWSAVASVRASTSQRYGLRTTVLEIDAGERLVVLDKRDLAADPWAVARAIGDFRGAR
ncbi:MAG: PH domain-containing protein [Jatrophihabitans sp.]